MGDIYNLGQNYLRKVASWRPKLFYKNRWLNSITAVTSPFTPPIQCWLKEAAILGKAFKTHKQHWIGEEGGGGGTRFLVLHKQTLELMFLNCFVQDCSKRRFKVTAKKQFIQFIPREIRDFNYHCLYEFKLWFANNLIKCYPLELGKTQSSSRTKIPQL